MTRSRAGCLIGTDLAYLGWPIGGLVGSCLAIVFWPEASDDDLATSHRPASAARVTPARDPAEAIGGRHADKVGP